MQFGDRCPEESQVSGGLSIRTWGPSPSPSPPLLRARWCLPSQHLPVVSRRQAGENGDPQVTGTPFRLPPASCPLWTRLPVTTGSESSQGSIQGRS